MDKIIIMTDHYDMENTFAKCLSYLFPDCEIEIKQRQTGFNTRITNADIKRNSDSFTGM